MKTPRQILRLTLGAVLAITATGAHACGEVMYRMGGALHYRAFITKHPAQIILYAPERRLDADPEAFHRNLEKAGHKVTVVATPDAFAQALREHPFDVVLGYASDLPVINSGIERVARQPSIIPVFDRAGGESSERREYPLALTADANLNAFLKTIEKSMKARGT